SGRNPLEQLEHLRYHKSVGRRSLGSQAVSYAIARAYGANTAQNKLSHEDRAVHDWYRFVLSFPPHLVREYVERFQLAADECLLDSFCGTGTTLVEAKKMGIPSIGIEGNPLASFVAGAKVDWDIDPSGLIEHATSVADKARARLHATGVTDAGEPAARV